MGQHKLPADHPLRIASAERHRRIDAAGYQAAEPEFQGKQYRQRTRQGIPMRSGEPLPGTARLYTAFTQ